MIFKPVNKLNSNYEKKEFLELVDIYCRLVEVYCEKNNIVNIEDSYKDNSKELILMGILEKKEDLDLLKKFLSNEYERFNRCVSFYLCHKKEMKPSLSKLNNSERKKIQQEEMKKKKPSVVDFFCGAGGLSLGFIQNGYSIALANDIEDVCISTYKYNHPELQTEKIIKGDIKEVIKHLDDYINKEIDVVIGGPPCQGFSTANQQRLIDDPRNKLYKYYLKAIEKICPKFVVMENVRGMLKVANQVVEDYKNIKAIKNNKMYTYNVTYKLLNSYDFSVAQYRERLIYIAVRNDVIEEKKITPEMLFEEINRNNDKNKKYLLKDALEYIKPLKAPRVKNTNKEDSDKYGKKIDVNNYDNNSNEYLSLINQNRYIPYVYNHKARYLSDVNYEIYKRLGQGEDATNEKIADIMPYPNRKDVFKDKYYKLIAEKPSRTITAHLKMDCHSHIHPYQIRALTPREAARIQSFPDDYLFLGPYLKTYMQIGNAVPCLMARGIAKEIKKYL